ncbi:tetratricopeptide repeat protein, partial [Escherichia coli]|nr:tetratricopeptide repeat protein [Escherichia coli]
LVKLEQPKLALPYLQRAVELNENDTEARFQFGMCLANEGMLDEALSQFAAVTEQDPGHADAFYNAGVTYAYKENREKALEMLDKA